MAATPMDTCSIISTLDHNQIKAFKFMQSNEQGPVVHYIDFNDKLQRIPISEMNIPNQLQFTKYLKEQTCFEDIEHVIKCNNQMINIDNLTTREISVKLKQKQINNDIIKVQGVVVATYDNNMNGHNVESFLKELKQQLCSKSNLTFDYDNVKEKFFIFVYSKIRN